MTDIILFGGTTEGRALFELLKEKQIETLMCVATEYGETLLTPSNTIRVHMGRLNREEMTALIKTERPRIVIDATHPYAAKVSGIIAAACKETGVKRLRILRGAVNSEGCKIFPHMNGLIEWLNERPGMVFSALGGKEAAALTMVEGYRERVWLRILPDAAGLSACIGMGFLARRIICMQGPFSKELNAAMFREAKADILLTKESGAEGGYPEKLGAARECGITVAVLARPEEETGITLAAVSKLILEGAI